MSAAPARIGQTVRVRAWLLALVLVVVAVGGFVWTQRDDNECTFASTSYNGTVLPGGPQTPEEALEGFLASGQTNAATGDEFPADPSGFDRGVGSEGANSVTFTSERTTIHATRMANGWFIDSAGTTC